MEGFLSIAISVGRCLARVGRAADGLQSTILPSIGKAAVSGAAEAPRPARRFTRRFSGMSRSDNPGRSARCAGLIRALVSVSLVLIGLATTHYLYVEGWPLPTHAGMMFYEWRQGDRGWGYWPPQSWTDDHGNRLIIDFDRNLIAYGPIEGIDDWQTTSSHVVFYAHSLHPIQIADCRNKVFVLGPEGLRERAIQSGVANRLIGECRSLGGSDLRACVYQTVPEIRELLQD